MIHKGYSLSIPTSANQRLSVSNERTTFKRTNQRNQPEWHPLLPALRMELSPWIRAVITLLITL